MLEISCQSRTGAHLLLKGAGGGRGRGTRKTLGQGNPRLQRDFRWTCHLRGGERKDFHTGKKGNSIKKGRYSCPDIPLKKKRTPLVEGAETGVRGLKSLSKGE